MRFKKIGNWSVNASGKSGSTGVYVEADLPASEPRRYAAVDPSYADLEEREISRLMRGEWVEIPCIEATELAERIDQIDLRH